MFMVYRFRITKITYDVDPTFQHETTPSFRVEAEEVNKEISNDNPYLKNFQLLLNLIYFEQKRIN